MSITLTRYNNNTISATVRTVIIDGEPWFVAQDVCRQLGLTNPSKALEGLDDDEYTTLDGVITESNIGGFGGRLTPPTNITDRYIGSNSQPVDIFIRANGGKSPLVVNESGLYHLIFKSQKPEAKAFRKWVTSEVLPQIRKTGRYGKSNVSNEAINRLIKAAETVAEHDYAGIPKMQYTYPGLYYPLNYWAKKYHYDEDTEDALDAISLQKGYGVKMNKKMEKSWHADVWAEFQQREQSLKVIKAGKPLYEEESPKVPGITFDI